MINRQNIMAWSIRVGLCFPEHSLNVFFQWATISLAFHLLLRMSRQIFQWRIAAFLLTALRDGLFSGMNCIAPYSINSL